MTPIGTTLATVSLKHPVTVSEGERGQRIFSEVILRMPDPKSLRRLRWRAMLVTRAKRDEFRGRGMVAIYAALPESIVNQFDLADISNIMDRMDDELSALTGIPREQFRIASLRAGNK